MHPVDDGGGGGNQLQVEFTLQPLLDDLHVEKPEKSAAETEAEGKRGFGLVGKGGIVQLELGESVAQLFILDGVDGIEAGKHHGLHFLEPGERRGTGFVNKRHRVAYLGILYFLDAGNDKTDLACGKRLRLAHNRREDPDLQCLIGTAVHHEENLVPLFEDAVDDADEDDDPLVLVIPGIEQERLQRLVRVPDRRRNFLDYLLQDFPGADTLLGAGKDRIVSIDADDVLDLLHHPLGFSRRQIDLVEHREYLQVVLKGQINVRQRLSLDPLRRIDDQQASFTGGQRPGDLVGKIDMTRCVDQIQDVFLAVEGPVIEPDGLGLDGDAPLPLQVHFVQELVLLFAIGKGTGELQQPVGQGRFPVIDMCNNGEISDISDEHDVLFRLKSCHVRL